MAAGPAGSSARTAAPGEPQPGPLGRSPERVEEFFARLSAANPAPRTELAYADPFTLLVAVVLSAQATDVGVNKVTRRLFELAPTPAAMLALGEEGIREQIRSLGLFRNKARNVHALAGILAEQYGGQVPRDRAALEALPGVGRKTANVVLNEVFGEPTIAVDTHIFRVANRTGLAPGRTPREVEDLLMEVVPPAYRKGAHHWLILHGRYVCTARNPACPTCVVRDLCDYARTAPRIAELADARKPGAKRRRR